MGLPTACYLVGDRHLVERLARGRLERSLARRKCDACGKQGEISERPFPTCDLCGHRRYCGRRCQRADWLTHKVDCPGYAQQQMMET